VKLHEIEFPDESTAKYETVDVPNGKFEPGASPVLVGTTVPSQLSLATGSVQVTDLKQLPGDVWTLKLLGQVIVGFSLSAMVTWKKQLFEFPAVSTTSYSIVVSPLGKAVLGPGPMRVGTIDPSQLSFDEGSSQ